MGGTRTQDEEGHTIVHGIVPLFAAISYFAMAIHQGQVTLSSGRVFLFARYVDWSVTTPILLLSLSMVALHGAHRRAGLVAGLLASDLVMILTGMFFGLSEDPFAKWTWYITSCVAFAAAYYILLLPMMREAVMRDGRGRPDLPGGDDGRRSRRLLHDRQANSFQSSLSSDLRRGGSGSGSLGRRANRRVITAGSRMTAREPRWVEWQAEGYARDDRPWGGTDPCPPFVPSGLADSSLPPVILRASDARRRILLRR